jgi:uncharacterized membrane protein
VITRRAPAEERSCSWQRPYRAAGGIVDLISISLIVFAAWLAVLVVVVAMCRAAARAESESERAEARLPNAVLFS